MHLPTVLETGSPKIKEAAWSGSGESPLLGWHMAPPSHCPTAQQRWRQQAAWHLLSLRRWSLLEGPTHMTSSKSKHPQEPHFQIPSHWRLGLQHTNFSGGHNSVYSTVLTIAQRGAIVSSKTQIQRGEVIFFTLNFEKKKKRQVCTLSCLRGRIFYIDPECHPTCHLPYFRG